MFPFQISKEMIDSSSWIRTFLVLVVFIIFVDIHGICLFAQASTDNHPTLACPSSGSEIIPSGLTVKLAFSSKGKLCTLTQSNLDGSDILPVGRSYDGYGWEAVAGPYSATMIYNCDNESCEVTLPELNTDNQILQLTSYEHDLSRKDTSARFFEQATFGTTEEDLRKVENLSEDTNLSAYFANWTYHQIYHEEITSHRSFWRERTLSRYDKFYGKEGKAPKPCDEGSYWRGFALSELDMKKKAEIQYSDGTYTLIVDGQLRTTSKSFQLEGVNIDSFPLETNICWVEPHLSGLVTLFYDEECRTLVGGNPSIDLSDLTDSLNIIEGGGNVGDVIVHEGRIDKMLLGSNLDTTYCETVDEAIFMKVNYEGIEHFLYYEPRLLFGRNSKSTPMSDGGGTIMKQPGGDVVQCSNAPRTFLNQDSCRLARKANTCTPSKVLEGSVKLNTTNIPKFFDVWRYVYAVNQLRLEDDYDILSPCEHGVRSRWKRSSARTCSENIHSQTASIFGQMIEDEIDPNPHVKDLFLPSDKDCHWDDKETVIMTMKVGSECWETVHPDYLNVYDFSDWAEDLHPGNRDNDDSIKQFALNGSHLLQYPSHHAMKRWRKKSFPYLGRLGDEVDFKDFPDTLRSERIAELFGLVSQKFEDGKKSIICGSPFEVKSGLHRNFFSITRRPQLDFLKPHEFKQQRRTVWTMIAISAPDQLRQRVAWALSQLLVISPSAVSFPFQTESFLTYYDIFVRHAFANYRDILKEVAYSPMMGEMLSYLESKSKEYVWVKKKQVQFADENFAREIMQLFSIGLVQLHNDGTSILDVNKNPIPTYNNDDIEEYARVWTGFRRQTQRGNVEERGYSQNTIDPMAIRLKWRDQLPKMGLGGKYIGDTYPLCSEIPSDSFLKKDAFYRLLGKNLESDIQNIPSDSDPLTLDKLSSLYLQLCQQDENESCSYPATINLSSDLECTADECELSHPKILHLGDDIHYEYIRPPCVNLSFTESKRQIIVIDSNGKVAFERESVTEDNFNTLTYFRVPWKDAQYPRVENSCGNGICQEMSGSCVCEAIAKENRVFSSKPTRSEILAQLHVGALSPSLSEYNGIYYPEFTMYYTKNQFGRNSIFEVKDDYGKYQRLKNFKSTVVLMKWGGEESSPFEFRNPVSFYDAESKSEVLDAQYETDAALDHYFYHQNTGPFIALRLIQRFGISNPSNQFIERCSDSFRSGKYTITLGSETFSYGSGEYGDLGAIIATIIMDTESRTAVLDADPSFGALREPLLKVIALMRNMAYIQTSSEFVSLHGLEAKLGQSPHDLPSVFSFFLPEYAPPGVITRASLVAPEAMLLQNSIGLANGLNSLLSYGLNSCDGGFGRQLRCFRNKSLGFLSYSPNNSNDEAQVVDDLATILTSGRLSIYHRNLVGKIYSKQEDKTEALTLAQKLIVNSPEFSALGVTRETQEKRQAVEAPSKTCQEYKAVVHILLKGGCDSFNLLVPHSLCQDRDMYSEYKNVRGSVSIDKADLLPIDTASSNQVCDVFGVHPALPILKDIYDDGEAAFLAGIGVMSEPVSRENYMVKTKTELFAHNTIQAEIGRLDPYMSNGKTGALGRLADVLSSRYNVNSFAVDTSLVALEGGTNSGVMKTAVNSEIGFQKFNPSALEGDTFDTMLKLINGDHFEDSNFFSQTWSSSLHESITLSDRLYSAQNSVKLNSTFPSSTFGQQLELIAKVIGSNECRGSSRDIFYVETGSFDHHSDVLNKLESEFDLINDGLTSFVNEIKNLPNDVWDKVTVVVSSDFGRTLSENSGGGTDHGWSGNNFMFGGSVQGGKIFGEYPSDLNVNNELDVGRGRFIPTMPFEAPWNAVCQWLGIDDESELEKILPNRKSFPDMMLDQSDVFKSKPGSYGGGSCEDEGRAVSCIPTDPIIDDDYYNWNDDGNDNSMQTEKNNSTTIIMIVIPSIIIIAVGLARMIILKKRANINYKYFEHEGTFDLSNSDISIEDIHSVHVIHYKKGNKGIEIYAGDTSNSSSSW